VAPSLNDVGWSKEDQWRWAEAVNDDVRPMVIGRDTILAEITRFHRRQIRQKLTVERLRAPFLDVGNSGDLTSWISALPRAVWVDVLYRFPMHQHRLSCAISHSGHIRGSRTACNLSTMAFAAGLADASGKLADLRRSFRGSRCKYCLVERCSAGDINDDVIWGEGILVLLTPEGRRQLEALLGPLCVYVNAGRRFVSEGGREEGPSRQATARE